MLKVAVSQLCGNTLYSDHNDPISGHSEIEKKYEKYNAFGYIYANI